ncbi:hypothetical protein GCM10010236_52540 [Streptomyces eurythermus]|nr:hypothetical protein GCM10010236_52540 [Streptomyces eurythermus]
MQQDPVDESAEPHSQQDAGQAQTGGRGVAPGVAYGRCHRSSSRSIRVDRFRLRCPHDSYQFPDATAASGSANCAARWNGRLPTGRGRPPGARVRIRYPAND